MIGQMTKFKDYSEKDYEPIDVNSLSHFVDMRGLREYAREKGVKIVDLPQEEKERFLIANRRSIPMCMEVSGNVEKFCI